MLALRCHNDGSALSTIVSSKYCGKINGLDRTEWQESGTSVVLGACRLENQSIPILSQRADM